MIRPFYSPTLLSWEDIVMIYEFTKYLYHLRFTRIFSAGVLIRRRFGYLAQVADIWTWNFSAMPMIWLGSL